MRKTAWFVIVFPIIWLSLSSILACFGVTVFPFRS